MVQLVSHIEGRTRLSFPNLYEKESFIKNVKNMPGVNQLESNGKTLNVLVKYEPDSPCGYLIKQIISKPPKPKISKEDISSYVAPVLKEPMTKALWLIFIFGPKVGFLQFSISSMIVNRYIKARFG
ncbi:MAG TPA: hypothetical protein VLB01_00780 [Thermodesulfobacteriota bacterium]|nr:hypothetical protein [Thermodesulfobacteriota bacterium]